MDCKRFFSLLPPLHFLVLMATSVAVIVCKVWRHRIDGSIRWVETNYSWLPGNVLNTHTKCWIDRARADTSVTRHNSPQRHVVRELSDKMCWVSKFFTEIVESRGFSVSVGVLCSDTFKHDTVRRCGNTQALRFMLTQKIKLCAYICIFEWFQCNHVHTAFNAP